MTKVCVFMLLRMINAKNCGVVGVFYHRGFLCFIPRFFFFTCTEFWIYSLGPKFVGGIGGVFHYRGFPVLSPVLFFPRPMT